jgi:hypothetical protein
VSAITYLQQLSLQQSTVATASQQSSHSGQASQPWAVQISQSTSQQSQQAAEVEAVAASQQSSHFGQALQPASVQVSHPVSQQAQHAASLEATAWLVNAPHVTSDPTTNARTAKREYRTFIFFSK